MKWPPEAASCCCSRKDEVPFGCAQRRSRKEKMQRVHFGWSSIRQSSPSVASPAVDGRPAMDRGTPAEYRAARPHMHCARAADAGGRRELEHAAAFCRHRQPNPPKTGFGCVHLSCRRVQQWYARQLAALLRAYSYGASGQWYARVAPFRAHSCASSGALVWRRRFFGRALARPVVRLCVGAAPGVQRTLTNFAKISLPSDE